MSLHEQARRGRPLTSEEYTARVERDAQLDRNAERELSRLERHTPAPDFHQHRAPDGCRAFPEPPPGFRLVWVHGERPVLEAINEEEKAA
jgi:hypothetical protein